MEVNIKRIHIVVATTLFAFLLWFSVGMTEQYQEQLSAPLVIESLPPGKALASPLPRTVKLTFNEFGWRLAKLYWRSNLEWVVNLSAAPGRHALTVKDFADQLGWRLGVQPISMTPESLYIALDTLVSKRVPIAPNFTLTFREGYGQVGSALITPESITVTGAKSLLEAVNEWPTEHRMLDRIRQSVDEVVSLVDTTNVLSLAPKQADLHIEVQQFAEQTFPEIPIECLSVPQNREVILSSPNIEIVVRCGLEQLSRLNQKSFRAILDYRTVLADTSGIIQPEIELPPGVQIVRRSPERFTYVVRKKF